MTSIARYLPKSLPTLSGPLFLLAAFSLLSMQGVIPLYSLSILASGLILSSLFGLYALTVIIPFTAWAFFEILPLDPWSIGLFFAVTVAFFQIAVADTVPDTEIIEKEELLKERYTHTLHEKEALNTELEKQVKSLSLELGKLRLELDAQEKVLDLARAEVSSLLKLKEAVDQEKNALEIRFSKAEEKLHELESVKKALQASNLSVREKEAEIKTLNGKIDELESSYPDQEAIKQAIVHEMTEHIESIEKEKALLESTVAKLQGDYEEAKSHHEIAFAKAITELEVIKSKQEDTIAKLEEELSQTKEALNQAQNPTIEPGEVNPAQFSKLQGMYKQLREQFEEKNHILESTRKELFHTSERAEILQKELAELHLNGKGLPEYLENVQKLEQDKDKLSAEIIRLEELISSLISRK